MTAVNEFLRVIRVTYPKLRGWVAGNNRTHYLCPYCNTPVRERSAGVAAQMWSIKEYLSGSVILFVYGLLTCPNEACKRESYAIVGTMHTYDPDEDDYLKIRIDETNDMPVYYDELMHTVQGMHSITRNNQIEEVTSRDSRYATFNPAYRNPGIIATDPYPNGETAPTPSVISTGSDWQTYTDYVNIVTSTTTTPARVFRVQYDEQ